MTECFGKTLYYNHDLEKIRELPEEMQLLWITTKVKQIEANINNNHLHLQPLDPTEMNLILTDTLYNVDRKLEGYSILSCSISGGSDSDTVLDILARSTKKFKDIRYVFFDTGIEYQATKDHLEELERKYQITIEREKAIKSIPFCCHEYGIPFLSKYVSENIARLQKHGFTWEDKPYEELIIKYPKCKSSIEWWCNKRPSKLFNINRNKFLKEFLIENPPDFKISNLCCKYAKKDVIMNFNKKNKVDCSISGIRRSEGGIRSGAYKSCFTDDSGKGANFRPIFWLTDGDKEQYCNTSGIIHSRCYTEYGMKRTGCAGCPFGRDFEKELEIIKTYEPKLYTMVNNVFGRSYKYTRQYREYVKQHS